MVRKASFLLLISDSSRIFRISKTIIERTYDKWYYLYLHVSLFVCFHFFLFFVCLSCFLFVCFLLFQLCDQPERKNLHLSYLFNCLLFIYLFVCMLINTNSGLIVAIRCCVCISESQRIFSFAFSFFKSFTEFLPP